MDLEDWEFLPDHGFIDYREDYPKKSNNNIKNNMFNMDHFKCPSSPPQRAITVPFHFDQPDDVLDKKKKKKHVITKLPLEAENKIESSDAFDQTSQVFFKKMKENEFVDMKLDSPKSPNNNNNRVSLLDDDDEAKSTKIDTEIKKNEELVDEESSDGNMNLWKMSLTGIGAICSFGVAAATISIIVLGSHHRNNKHNQKKFHFQIYTDDDKRIKQVVHHATKLNEAISSVRGVPVTRAHISFGGYYDTL